MAIGVAALVLMSSEAWFAVHMLEFSIDPDAGRLEIKAKWLSVGCVVLFLAAALTDALDGMVARARGEVSELGALLDPIADKVLVIVPLIAVAVVEIAPDLFVLLPLAAIIVRDVLMTIARLREPGAKHLKVSRLAKLKTCVEFLTVGLGVCLAVQLVEVFGGASSQVMATATVSFVVLLWVSAGLSLWTAFRYRRKKT